MPEKAWWLALCLCSMSRLRVNLCQFPLQHAMARVSVITAVTTESHHGLMPIHTARISMSMAETRVDYMSSCILLGRASELEVAVWDLWEGLQLAGQDIDGEEANIQVN